MHAPAARWNHGDRADADEVGRGDGKEAPNVFLMRTSWPEASLFRIRQERPLAAPPEAGREADGLLAGPAAEHCADAAGPEGRPQRPI